MISFSGTQYQLDLRGTEFGELIGFEKKLITKTEYGTKLPNITNSIDVLNIKKAAKTAATKAVTTAATKTGEHVGEKAGDKIINFLTKKKRNDAPKKVTFDETVKPGDTIVKILSKNSTPSLTKKPKSMTQKEINQRLNLILSDD